MGRVQGVSRRILSRYMFGPYVNETKLKSGTNNKKTVSTHTRAHYPRHLAKICNWQLDYHHPDLVVRYAPRINRDKSHICH